MAVFVFYRIPLDFLQKEWMYRGVMLRIMSPGRFCLQGRAYRFHPVSMREAWQVCFVRSFRNSKCGFPPFGPSDSRSGACQTQRTRTHLRSGSLCLTLRFIYTRLPPLRGFFCNPMESLKTIYLNEGQDQLLRAFEKPEAAEVVYK